MFVTLLRATRGCETDVFEYRFRVYILKMTFFDCGTIIRTNFKHEHIKGNSIFNVTKSLWTDFKSDDFWNRTIYTTCVFNYLFSILIWFVNKFQKNRILEKRC